MRHLFYVIGALEIGGAQRHLSVVLPGLVARGWQVTVFCLTDRGPFADGLEAAGIRVLAPRYGRNLPKTLRILRFPLRILTLWLLLMLKRPSLVHFFLPHAYVFGAPGAILARLPRLMSRRSLNDYFKADKLCRTVEPVLHRQMHQLLGNAEAVCAQLEQETNGTVPVGLIYNGIETEIYDRVFDSSEMRKALGLKDSDFLMIMVANLIPYKGHADLLQALFQIKDQLPTSWKLLVVGRDDGIGEALKHQAEQVGLSDHILWLGQRMDVAELLLASDLGLLVSHEEGFSNSVLEGMAAGLPMIVTDVGGNREAVLDGETGLVVPSHDPEHLGEAIHLLAADADKRRAFGAAGRARLDQQFSLKACIDAYDAVYRKLIGNKP